MCYERYSKEFVFPKIAYSSKRRMNLPVVEMEFRMGVQNGDYSLAIHGEIWNGRHTDCVTCGQCLDDMNDIPELRNNPIFAKLYRLWNLYHLNDMHAGTIAQERAVKEWCETNWYCYDKACKMLEERGLLVDNGYEYGTAWLWRAIPDEDLDIIGELLGADLSEFKAKEAA